MTIGDKITITAGKHSCVYSIVDADNSGFTLRRVKKHTSKADNNRFNDTIIIKKGWWIGGTEITLVSKTT